MEFSGRFETHVTVQTSQLEELHRLEEWALGSGLKFLLIELARGHSRMQPMVSWRAQGTLTSQKQRLFDVETQLKNSGFQVSRGKIECDPSNDDVPRTDQDAASLPDSLYFEHHIKLMLNPDADLAALFGLSEMHQAHLSRNVFRVREDGYLERFVTQRCRRIGLLASQKRLGLLVEDLLKDDWKILDVESEFVVIDSNESLDAGWLTI